jgi:type II secretory pathway component GspD/PulD (secretin)
MRPVLSVAVLLALTVAVVRADEKAEDTPLAAKTRKLLKKKISVEFKDTRLEEAMDEIKDSVKGIKFLLDSKGGVSRNSTVTYTAKDKSVEEIFDEMFKKLALGYIVISKKGNAYDGLVQVRKTDERGYEKKKN